MYPVAEPLSECKKISGTGEVVKVNYDLEHLHIFLDFEDLSKSIEVIFSTPIGFRVLDEGDLVEFWKDYHTDNGWIYLVKSGGWHDLESTREGYLNIHGSEVREYLIVGENDCVSVLSHESNKPRVLIKNAT